MPRHPSIPGLAVSFAKAGNAGSYLHEVRSQGTIYVVASPGAPFQVQVHRGSEDSLGKHVKVSVRIDGRSAGQRRRLRRDKITTMDEYATDQESSHASKSRGKTRDRAFRFAGVVIEGVDYACCGRIHVRVFQKDADVPVWDITVQYRTAAALLQKKILNPKGNTQHKAPYSSKAADPRTAGPTAAGASTPRRSGRIAKLAASGPTRTSSHGTAATAAPAVATPPATGAAGVRRAAQATRARQHSTAARASARGAATGRSRAAGRSAAAAAAAEPAKAKSGSGTRAKRPRAEAAGVWDLTKGLTVMANGHVLEAHEYAVCDMSGDAMPSWEVKKKQCIDLV